MDITVKTADGKIEATLSGETQQDIFKELHAFQEIFEINTCGKCMKKNLRYVVRQDKEENEYFELQCKDCKAKFEFGSMKKPKGRLFPKRKDKDGNWKPNHGWTKWDKDKGVAE